MPIYHILYYIELPESANSYKLSLLLHAVVQVIGQWAAAHLHELYRETRNIRNTRNITFWRHWITGESHVNHMFLKLLLEIAFRKKNSHLPASKTCFLELILLVGKMSPFKHFEMLLFSWQPLRNRPPPNGCQSNGNSVFCRLSNQPINQAQRPGPPTPPFTPTDSQWPSTLDAVKKSCSMQPHWSRWMLSWAQADALWRYGNMRRKPSESTCDKQLIGDEQMDVF